MLTKRTHILFDEGFWKKLVQLADREKTSIGQLVRQALEEKYMKEDKLEQRRRAIEATFRDRPASAKGKIDYKALINAGRKY